MNDCKIPQVSNNDYCQNFVYPWEMIGQEVASGPWANFVSAQRLAMMAKNLTQWCLIKFAEFPRCYTGIETAFSKYTFEKSPLDQDVMILRVINKYGEFQGDKKINENPTFTIVYKGIDDNKIGCFDVSSYRYLSRGFGYFNKIKNKHLLHKGQRIPKELTFAQSPVIDDCLYKMGINANVAYLPLGPTTADAFIVSDWLANRMTTTQIYEIEIPITENLVPLNIYGIKPGEHKFFPDIGEYVNESGILAALRPFNMSGLIKDYTEERLKEFNPNSDIPYRIEPGAKVIDVDVYTAPNRWNEINSENSPYNQLAKYQSNLYNYYNEILRIYEENPHDKFTSKMIRNLARYSLMMPEKSKMNYHGLVKGKKPKNWGGIFNKGIKIDFCLLKITVAVEVPLTVGSKLTGRDGSKGTVSAIWKREHMPRDEQGFVADIIINSNSIPNRMNISQLYEQFFNRLSDLVIKDTFNMSMKDCYKTLITYLMDFDPDYGKLVKEATYNEQEQFVQQTRDDGLFLNVPCTKKHFGEEHTLFMARKYNYRESPLTLTYPIDDNTFKTITTWQPECIGSKYIFLINKVPYTNAIELGYVSQLRVPVKNKHTKQRSISQTAIRFGEDEFRIWLIGVKASVAARILNVSGNNPECAKEIFYLSMTMENPSSLRKLPYTNSEIANGSVILKMIQHVMLTSGIDMTPEAVYSLI